MQIQLVFKSHGPTDLVATLVAADAALGNDLTNNPRWFDAGQSLLEALELVSQFHMIQAQEVKDRGL